MGLFKRASTTSAANSGSSLGPELGRVLGSSMSVDECLTNFTEVARSEFTGKPKELQWVGSTTEAPIRVVGIDSGRNDGQILALAIWDAGPSREMHLIIPGYAGGGPFPMIGQWKMRDSSLSSRGTVRSFPVQGS
jgi:hypothetical protein